MPIDRSKYPKYPHEYNAAHWIYYQKNRRLSETPPDTINDKINFLCSKFPDKRYEPIQATSPVEAATIFALARVPRPQFVYVLYEGESPKDTEPFRIQIGQVNRRAGRHGTRILSPKK